ncbi:hypothetical protein QUF54_00850 [Candidatus Marithioploca araucensis]|uniref:Uncharacterized protein n=1 Tax=Candidatus Marithioploca araucensis TaxID=70273 RepID=A0ABT7VS78_9GAMM|nr:hypothetical protein [Candidatus Marithioploca araucensis]
MIKQYAQWVIRWRYFIILATLILVALATRGFPLRFDTDYRVFFSEPNPQLIAFDDLQNTYTKNDNVMFVLAPQDGQVFTNKTLEAVEWLTNEAWQISYSIRVDSITNFQYTYMVCPPCRCWGRALLLCFPILVIAISEVCYLVS